MAVVSEKLLRVLVYDEAAHTVAWLAENDLHPENPRWWCHPELGIPVAGEAEGLGKVLLTELEVFAP